MNKYDNSLLKPIPHPGLFCQNWQNKAKGNMIIQLLVQK